MQDGLCNETDEQRESQGGRATHLPADDEFSGDERSSDELVEIPPNGCRLRERREPCGIGGFVKIRNESPWIPKNFSVFYPLLVGIKRPVNSHPEEGGWWDREET